ncbi:MAG: bifunctional glutamate N-acetyltransferase/amino-acid acetyltransferase ArgJ [Deltaproteobacteria bacterium]|nr:bifunctional glutamate N-acetyltransferase/amino-acid acetyltransferase ArgJ [Candidatus Zymogenaceae bacterium]
MTSDEPACPGFRAAGIAAGIKKTGDPDLALIVADNPTAGAAVFTENRVKAAPVLLSMERLQGARPQAVLINSGGANACTGSAGIGDARTLTGSVARSLGIPQDSVLAASTGVIGQRLPVDRIEKSLGQLINDLSADGFVRAARAIMTTDTYPKCIAGSFSSGGRDYRVLGIAKGAGMIFPHLATMLAFAVTDFPIARRPLEEILKGAVSRSFNAITVDGDMSTNDMVLILSGGTDRPGNTDSRNGPFREALTQLCIGLARHIVKDAEGATKLVAITVSGAPDEGTARRIAFQVANSPLVKTAFFGEDPNWGRIMGALGCVAGSFDPARAEIRFGDVTVASGGVGCSGDREAAAREVMRQREYTVIIDLGAGSSSFTAYTSDLSVDYVKINADYRS